jgi:hypothetical protein
MHRRGPCRLHGVHGGHGSTRVDSGHGATYANHCGDQYRNADGDSHRDGHGNVVTDGGANAYAHVNAHTRAAAYGNAGANECANAYSSTCADRDAVAHGSAYEPADCGSIARLLQNLPHGQGVRGLVHQSKLHMSTAAGVCVRRVRSDSYYIGDAMPPRRYRFYFDESGDHAFRELTDPARRYLGITGLAVECEYYRTTFHPALEALKQKHFPHSPDDPVILHRKELIGCRGPFSCLREAGAEVAFNNDLLALIGALEYVIITVVLDKARLWAQYGDQAFHPYHYCMSALLERYCGLLRYWGASGDVMGESRGGVEDRQLKQAFKEVHTHGTFYHAASFFQRTLTSAEVKLKRKEANIAGLQVADLLAYVAKQDCLIEKGIIGDPGNIFSRRIAAQIVKKYNRWTAQNRVEGYGRVFLGFK